MYNPYQQQQQQQQQQQRPQPAPPQQQQAMYHAPPPPLQQPQQQGGPSYNSAPMLSGNLTGYGNYSGVPPPLPNPSPHPTYPYGGPSGPQWGPPPQHPQQQHPPQQQQQQQQQPQQQQQNYGYGLQAQGLQPQLTSYYAQGSLNSQQVSPQPQRPQLQQLLAPVSVPAASAPAPAQSAPAPAPVLEPLRPNATGFVKSFSNKGINTELQLPLLRLNFLTTSDQAKFETLFRSVVKNGSQTITGDDARVILMRSGLEPAQLARIWALADTNKAGELLFPEFALAMHLVNQVLQGGSIPFEIDRRMKEDVEKFIDAINFSVASRNSSADNLLSKQQQRTPFDDLATMANVSTMPQLQPQQTGYIPQTSFGLPLQSQPTGGIPLAAQNTGFMSLAQPVTPALGSNLMPMKPQGTGMNPQFTGGHMTAQTTGSMLRPQSTGSAIGMPELSFSQPSLGAPTPAPMQPQQTGYLPPSQFTPTMPLTAQKTGFGQNEIYSQSNSISNLFTTKETSSLEQDSISPEEKSLFYNVFDTYDVEKTGLLNFKIAAEVFRKSGLNRSDLEHIWNLCDTNNSGQLNRQEFALGMHLIYRRINGHQLPSTLPPNLIPSSTRILNNVKNQIKGSANNNKKEQTRRDGLAYKNNDDEVLPCFKNRRKTFNSESSSKSSNDNTSTPAVSLPPPPPPPPAPLEATDNKEKIEKLKAAIEERKIKLIRERARSKQQQESLKEQDRDIVRQIEQLKQQVRSLPLKKDSTLRIPPDIKNRFDLLTSKIPTLFHDISMIDDQIANAKIQLYRLKFPSLIIGSGPNGEITEYDQKKARQKALLASRMAELTGKPANTPSVADLEKEEQGFNQEVAKIKEEHKRNQGILDDIKNSVSEISSSVNGVIYGTNDVKDSAYERWVLGIGLEPEVYEFVKQLKAELEAKEAREIQENEKAREQAEAKTRQEAEMNAMKEAEMRARQEAEMRAREEAEMRAREEAEMRAREEAEMRAREEAETKARQELEARRDTEAQVHTQNHVQDPRYPSQDAYHGQYYSDYSSGDARAAYIKQQAELKSIHPKDIDPDDDDDDDDEEEKRLREQLEALRIKKKTERQAKLAKRREQTESEASHVESPSPPTLVTAAVSPPTVGNQPTQTSSSKSLSNTSTRAPFFKQESNNTSSYDLKVAEQQRRSQRGLDDDDGWSDEDDNTQALDQKPLEKKESTTPRQQDNDDSDVLSIPESIESEDETQGKATASNFHIPYIPPPPPLP